MDKQMDIKEIKERYSRCLRLDKLIEEKSNQLVRQRNKVAILYRELEKENQDVEELEKMSFSTLLTRITGQMEEKMEKEVQEAKIVELRFNDAKRIENEMLKELEQLKDEQYQLRNAKEDYKIALATKRDHLAPDAAQKLEALQKDLGDQQSVIKESQEAIEAGQDASDLVEQARRALSSAQNWGVVDMIGALDFIADIAKYQKINQAKKLMDDLQVALRRFKTELVDVRFDASFQVNISSFDSMLDFFFDNMFFDFMVQSKINDAKNEVMRIQGQIDSIMDQLEIVHEQSNEKMSCIREEIRQLIEES